MDKDGSSLETELINISKTKQMIEAIKNMENDEDRPAKRKRIVLTLEDKKNVILEREKGYSFEAVAKTFRIGVTTVKDIVKRKDAIMTAISMDRQFGRTRKVVNLGRKPEIEEQLYMYLVAKTEKNEQVCNKDLLERASVLNQELYNEDWTPSSGWLKKFKYRYCIETKSVNDNSINDDYDDETIFEDEIEMDDQQITSTPPPTCSTNQPKKVSNVSSVSVLNACDIILDFMSEYDFPLKEIITLRVVKDKMMKMPESQTLYEVHQETKPENEQNETVHFEVIECEENKEDVKL